MKIKYQALFILALASFTLFFQQETALAQKKKKSKSGETTQVELWDLDTMIAPIPVGRRLFTDKIEKTLDLLDEKDSTKDGTVTYRDEATTSLFTRAFMADAPRIIILTENLQIDHNEKVKYYKVLQDKLRAMLAMSWDTVGAAVFTDDLNNLRGLIIAQYRKNVMAYVQQNKSLISLQNIQLLEDNVIAVNDGNEAKAYLYRNLAKEYPAVLLERLPEIRDEPYADTIVADVAEVWPGKILGNAKSGPLNSLIRRNKDPIVQTLVRMAEGAKRPEKLLPFLGSIHRGEKTVAEVEGYITNDNKYFQEMVDLLISNEQLGREYIDLEIRNRSLAYANKINDAKDSAGRLAPIQNMRDVDYYVMSIAGKNMLSSGSFANGTCAQLIRSLNGKSGKALLQQMNNYQFRTFIRLCAAYGTLPDILKTMTRTEKHSLFKEFTERLEEGGLDDLSEATEVASTLPYITDEDITDQLRSDFYVHYDRVKAAKNEHTAKGILTYGILQILFNPDDNGKPVEERLNIDPVAQVPYGLLLNGAGELIEQVYCYTDKKGKSDYTTLINELKGNSAWKVTESGSRTKVSANSDKKITIYINKVTLDSQTVSPGKGQLQQNGVHPVVVFHFGPIGYLATTINALDTGVKIIVAGNNFGDDNTVAALRKNTGLHILASRQTSNSSSTLKVFSELNKQLSYGRDLSWADMWKELDSYYTELNPKEKEEFDHFVQPDKNRGVLFVKGYLETKRKKLNR